MVSTTSACSSKMNKLNEVLLAMEIAESKIEGSIRISLGAHTTENDILSFMNAFESVYKEIKELLKVMQYDHLLVRYGELTLKGTNRKMFVNQLKDNVKRALIPLSGYHVKGKRDRMYIELSPEADINEIIQRLSKVYGIKSISQL